MQKRSFPSIGADISLLGFGGMRLPTVGGDMTKIDYPVAQAMVDAAIAGGVNYFDTAWPYHAGHSERFLGEALAKYPRESFYLADKMPPWEIESAADLERIFETQLKRCRVEYFDFYLVHCLNRDFCPRYYDFAIYDFLQKKKEAGQIRRLGFSFHDDAELFAQLIAEHPWDFTQIQLNYLDWFDSDARALYELATQRGVPVIVMEPVRGGSLADLNAQATNILKTAAPDASIASWAIRFAASLPNVLTVLSGMTAPGHVADNLRTLTDFRPLSDAENRTLEAAVTTMRAAGTVPCTGCRYCMDCPAGVDIPRVFGVYNYFRTHGDVDTFTNDYRTICEPQQAHHCVACGTCVPNCPQKIDIPAFMAEITACEPRDLNWENWRVKE